MRLGLAIVVLYSGTSGTCVKEWRLLLKNQYVWIAGRQIVLQIAHPDLWMTRLLPFIKQVHWWHCSHSFTTKHHISFNEHHTLLSISSSWVFRKIVNCIWFEKRKEKREEYPEGELFRPSICGRHKHTYSKYCKHFLLRSKIWDLQMNANLSSICSESNFHIIGHKIATILL